MSSSKRQQLSGWGNVPVAECLAFRPEKYRDLGAILREHQGPLLARGLGRAYGDAALQPGGVIRTDRLDHLISFDTAQGIVRAQAGVSLAGLMSLSIPRGWLPPVIPGTRFVSLGGAVACNVHGKNNWREGEFAEHVLALRLLLPSGERVECSPSQNDELFWATAGGMGMTGVIEEVSLRLRPITSTSLKTLSYRVESIEDMIAAFEHYRSSSDYMVGWIDHRVRGNAIGRGVFESAVHIGPEEGGAPLSGCTLPRPRIGVPFFAPSFLLNRYSMGIYNRWRFRRYGTERHSETVDFAGFFHPLDSIAHWNRLYGRRGFFQYQCLLPETPDIGRQLRALLAALQKHGVFSFLAVIKYHRDGKGPLAFSRRGYSIALDFPNTHRVRTLLPQLDRWIAERGGRIYLAKDALLEPETFASMYGPAAAEWRNFICRTDPSSRFTSLMSERLRWKAEA